MKRKTILLYCYKAEDKDLNHFFSFQRRDAGPLLLQLGGRSPLHGSVKERAEKEEKEEKEKRDRR